VAAVFIIGEAHHQDGGPVLAQQAVDGRPVGPVGAVPDGRERRGRARDSVARGDANTAQPEVEAECRAFGARPKRGLPPG
jgi:hypothetical protein